MGIAIQAVIVVLLLKKGISNRTETLLFSSFSVIFLMSSVEYFVPSHFAMHTSVTILELLLGPLLIYYVQLTGKLKSSIPLAVYLIPPVSFFLLLVYSLFRGLSDNAFYSSTAFLMLEFLGILALIFYAFVAVTTLQRVRFGSSDLPQSLVSWMTVLVGCYLAQVMISFVYLFVYAVTDDNEYLWLSDTLISITIILVLFWQGIRLKAFFSSDSVEPNNDEIRWVELFKELDNRVKSEKLYLKQDLRIIDIAKIMSTNSKYVSKAINVAYGESLTHYLNGIRLQHFKKALREEKNARLNLYAIAEESGFSSKSSFNRYFKSREGVTPSEYRERISGS